MITFLKFKKVQLIESFKVVKYQLEKDFNHSFVMSFVIIFCELFFSKYKTIRTYPNIDSTKI